LVQALQGKFAGAGAVGLAAGLAGTGAGQAGAGLTGRALGGGRGVRFQSLQGLQQVGHFDGHSGSVAPFSLAGNGLAMSSVVMMALAMGNW
jgi:hypothetical protein